MEFFPDGTHVRLRSRAFGTYFYAEEDGVRITLSPSRASPNAAWGVHRLERGGTSYVLFRGAAYGRYFALESLVRYQEQDQGAPPGPGQGGAVASRAVQRDYDAEGQDDVLWEAHGAGDGSDDVLMSNRMYGVLCNYDDHSTSMRWMVEAIPPRADPPALPPVTPPPAVPIGGTMLLGQRRTAPPQVLYRRMIHYVRADFNQLVPRMLWFDGRSAFTLRSELAAQLGEADALGITLCVRAGSYGRLTPLITDLPANEQAMDIVVLTTGSPATIASGHHQCRLFNSLYLFPFTFSCRSVSVPRCWCTIEEYKCKTSDNIIAVHPFRNEKFPASDSI